MSQSRERLAALDGDNLTEAETTERDSLVADYPELEKRYQAAAISESTEIEAREIETETVDAESRELYDLFRRSSLGTYVQSAAEGRSLAEGPERELNAGLQISGERVPLAMLANLETRADTATAISANTIQRPASGLPRVFEGTASEFLGIGRQSVSGLAAFPVVTGGATAETVAKEAAKDAETFSLSVETCEPRRVSARYLFNREDAARLGPHFEESMRGDLRMAMASAMDKEVLNGQGTLINGLLDETPLQISGAADAALGDATTGNVLAGGLSGLIDGKYASTSGDIKAVFNPKFYGFLRTLPISLTSTANFMSEWLAMEKVQVMAAGHIGEITGQAGESYMIATLAKGLRGAAVHAIWDSVELVRDPYTNASTGQIALTLCGLHDFKVLRSANFAVRRVART